jgi:hypothetical protein
MDAGIHITRGTSLRLAPYDQAGHHSARR